MRMMLKAQMDTAAASKSLQDGRLPTVMQTMMEKLQPEAAYFGPDGGQRTAFSFSRWMTRPSCRQSASRCSRSSTHGSRSSRSWTETTLSAACQHLAATTEPSWWSKETLTLAGTQARALAAILLAAADLWDGL